MRFEFVEKSDVYFALLENGRYYLEVMRRVETENFGVALDYAKCEEEICGIRQEMWNVHTGKPIDEEMVRGLRDFVR